MSRILDKGIVDREERQRLEVDDFRTSLARALRGAMASFELTPESAAEALGVTRAAFYEYLGKRSIPGGEILARAITLWDLRLRYAGKELGLRKRQQKRRDDASSMQLPLFGKAQVIGNENITVSVGTKPSRDADLTLKVKFAS